MPLLQIPVRGAGLGAVERALDALASALVLLTDVAILLVDCAMDARVAARRKWVLAAVAVYLLSPADLVPGAVPLLGQVDDVGLIVWAARRLLQSAGLDVVRDLWRGADDGLALVLGAAGMNIRKDKV